MAAVEKSVDQVVREFRRVPSDRVKQLVEDFVSDGFTVEQVKEGDGSYTVRARVTSGSSRSSSASE